MKQMHCWERGSGSWSDHTVSCNNSLALERGTHIAMLLPHMVLPHTLLSMQHSAPETAPSSLASTGQRCSCTLAPFKSKTYSPAARQPAPAALQPVPRTVSSASTAMPRACRCCCSAGCRGRILLPHPTTTTSGGGSMRSSRARLVGVMSSKRFTSHRSHVSGRHRMGPSTLTLFTTKDCGRYLMCGTRQQTDSPTSGFTVSIHSNTEGCITAHTSKAV